MIAGLLLGAACSYSTKGFTGDPPPGEIPWQDYGAPLAFTIAEPTNESWLMPAQSVPLGDVIFVLDSGNNRVLKLSRHGDVIASLDSRGDPRLDLQRPMAMTGDGDTIVVANTDRSELLVLDRKGGFQRAVPVPDVGPRGLGARPIGVALQPDGGFVVSDANNHVVLFLDADGGLQHFTGSGVRADGTAGFNVPSGLTVDRKGNVFVVDVLNARVVELSPEGEFLRQISQRGAGPGSLSRPKGVAVDAEGRVFVSDGLLAAVQAFGPEGEYLGLIGRRETATPGTETPFMAPAGLWLDDGLLYVTDRFAGLLAFDVAGAEK